MKRIYVDGAVVILHTDYPDRQAAASLPGARWNAQHRCWTVPATPGVWAEIHRTFPAAAKEAVSICPACFALDAALQARIAAHWLNGDGEPDYPHVTKPWHHQIAATRHAIAVDALLLHCWMGTGKTKVTLDTCRARRHKTILVLCPTSVVSVWRDETAKHAPGEYRILNLRDGSVKQRAAMLKSALAMPGLPLLCCLNYEAAWREPMATTILSHRWGCLVLDESHRVKAPGSACSRFAAKIRATHKLALTGTPLAHSPLDLYGQYRALDPGVFGTRFSAFRDKFALMGGYGNHQVLGYRNQAELKSRMDTICHHVPREVLDLPPLQVLDRECELEPEARRIYDELESEFMAWVSEGVAVTASNALSKLLRLQQLTSGVAVTETGEHVQVSAAKAALLREMLDDLAGERVVVFARFVRDLETIHRAAQGAGFVSGEISGARRDYDRWRSDDSMNLLAVQIQSGSLGIDLTKASYGIVFSSGFSLAEYEQALARLHRPGQKSPVTIYRLLARGTVDRKIVRAIDQHRDVVESILAMNPTECNLEESSC